MICMPPVTPLSRPGHRAESAIRISLDGWANGPHVTLRVRGRGRARAKGGPHPPVARAVPAAQGTRKHRRSGIPPLLSWVRSPRLDSAVVALVAVTPGPAAKAAGAIRRWPASARSAKWDEPGTGRLAVTAVQLVALAACRMT